MPTRRGGRRSGAIPCCRLGDRPPRTIRRALRAPPVKVAAYSFLLGAQKGKAFPESSGLLRRQLRDPVDELFGVDRRAGTVERHIGTGPEAVIGDRLPYRRPEPEIGAARDRAGARFWSAGQIGCARPCGF